MCGRYVSSASTADLLSEFDVEEVVGAELRPSWNVAPTDPVRAILQRPPKEATEQAKPAEPHPAVRQLRTLRWGLVPSWSSDAKAAARRRCLLPAAGYYEWQKTDQGKVPHFLHDPAGRLLAMAGLYELWRDPALADDDPNRWLWTCTIITQQATDLLGEIHDRNPVLVPAELQAAWLDCSSDDPATARKILDQIPQARLEPYVVSPAVGNVRNDGPELIQPVELPEQEPLQL